LDVSLTNCFILWRFQARREGTKVDWDPVEFNRALGSALLVHDLSQKSSSTSNQVTTQTTRATLKTIAPTRCIGVLPGIPIRVEAVTDLKSILLARGHDMYKEDSRRGVGCEIDGKASGAYRVFGVNLTNVEYASNVGVNSAMFTSAEKGSVGRDITKVRSIEHLNALPLLHVK